VAASVLLPAAASAQDALAGKRLYLDVSRLRGTGVSCVDCHGGLPGGAFGIGRAANDAAAVERAVNSIPQMTPLRGRLGGSDFADLAAYIGRPSVPSPVLRSATIGAASTTADRIDFGAVAAASASRPGRWMLVNDGAVALTVLGTPTLRGSHPADFRIIATDCAAGLSLPGGAACSVDIEFRPQAGAGNRQAAIAVAHDWVSGEIALALTGEAVAANGSSPVTGPSSAAVAPTGGGGSVSVLFLAALCAVRRRLPVRCRGAARGA
jgi:mono/diheme cytochrome c family protein